MSDVIYSTLFIELDALLDSRASTLFRLNPEYLTSIQGEKYFERLSDEFEVDGYKELYSNRDRETLKNMLITEMGGMLIDFCERTLENTAQTPFHYSPKIIINIHPYKLEEEEIALIIAGVRSLTRGMCDIEAMDMSYEQITPVFVKSKLTILVLYDYTSWLETQSLNKNFERTICPDVSLFGPRIAFKKLDSIENLEINPFEAMEQLAAPLINLKLLPVSHFCFTKQHLGKKQTA